MLVVMGIDPGVANTGFGIVRLAGSQMSAIDGGVIDGSGDEPPERRLARIHASLDEQDDVDAVHANFDIPADVLEQVAA